MTDGNAGEVGFWLITGSINNAAKAKNVRQNKTKAHEEMEREFTYSFLPFSLCEEYYAFASRLNSTMFFFL